MSGILYAIDKLTEKMVAEAINAVLINKKPQVKLSIAFGCIKDFKNRADEEVIIAWNENMISYWNSEFNILTFCSRNEKMILNMHNRDIRIEAELITRIRIDKLHIILDMSNIDFVETASGEDNLFSLISIATEVVIHNNTLTALDSYSDKCFRIFQQAEDLKRVEIKDCRFEVDNLNSLFEECYNLEEVILENIEIADIEEVSKFAINELALSGLFDCCHKLKEVDLTTFLKYDEYITDIDCLFNECDSLTKIKGLDKFKFNKVKTATYAFADCYELKEVDLSSAEFKVLDEASNMFYNSFNIEYINMSKAEFSELVDCTDMFDSLSSLKELHIENMGKGKKLYFDILEMFSSLTSNCKVYLDNKISLKEFQIIPSEDSLVQLLATNQSDKLINHKELINLHLDITEDFLIEVCNNIRYKSTSDRAYNFGKVSGETKFILIEATDKEIENFIVKQKLLGENVTYIGNAYISGNENQEQIIIMSNTIEIADSFKEEYEQSTDIEFIRKKR